MHALCQSHSLRILHLLTMKLVILFAVLFLHEDTASQTLSAGFYVPGLNLFGDLLSGRLIYKNPDQCKNTTLANTTGTDTNYYSDTEALYEAITTETSISAALQSDFTMGFTLKATSNNIAGSTYRVKGLTYKSFARKSIDYLDKNCLATLDLNKELVKSFESLPTNVKYPSEDNSWIQYRNFLRQFGSHMVTEVHRGASIYMNAFSRASESYSSSDFNVKACVNLVGPTNNGFSRAPICTGVTQQEAERVSQLHITSQFVAQGGTAATSAQLADRNNRNDSLIAKFLSEANATDQAIQYTFESIWWILQSKYINNHDNLVRALNLEAYYKGFLNFGCNQLIENGFVFQRFITMNQSGLPFYQCQLAPLGCHSDGDCSYNYQAASCQCRGATCVRYGEQMLSTGAMKEYAYANTAPGWKGPGCSLTYGCTCTHPENNWRTIWESQKDSLSLLSVLHVHPKFRSCDSRMKPITFAILVASYIPLILICLRHCLYCPSVCVYPNIFS